MGIDSNVSGVTQLVGPNSSANISGSSSIQTGISEAVAEVANEIVNSVKEQVQAALENIQLEADESVNEYLDPSTMTEEDWQRYENKLKEVIANSKTQKEKIANIAKFMAYDFPKLHYFWGGGHGLSEEEFMGLNREWGSDHVVTSPNSTGWIQNEYFPYSLDCGGFVSWVLFNAGVNPKDYYAEYDPEVDPCLNTYEIDTMGEHYAFGQEGIMDMIEPGDIAWQPSHTGVVVDVDKEAGTITVVHVSGSGQGTNVTTFNAYTGDIVADDLGEMPEFDGPYGRSRDGSSPYQEDTAHRGEGANTDPSFTLFTEFIHLD